ncbi:MAG: Flagellin protein FlaA [Candidatus Rifleibacterium amylolyticum]|nr:MAG: Flagellin protein FlaA [Candidatus Rifleibacterium amylolyticum]
MVIKATSSDRLHSNLIKSEEAKGKTLNRLASGKRINSASDDPAGLAMVMSLESQTRGLLMGINNRQDEISLLQTAEGALSSTGDILQRMNELAVQAANGTLTSEDRGNIQLEIDQLAQQVNQTANNTVYNDKKLLDGSFSIELQGGETMALPAANAEALGISSLDLTGNAGQAINQVGQAINSVSTQRGTIGAAINGISSQIAELQTEVINATAAKSRIEDADIAAELINMNLQALQSKAAIQAFKMQDENRATVLKLIDG